MRPIDEKTPVEPIIPLPLESIKLAFEDTQAPDPSISSASPVESLIFAHSETLGSSSDYQEPPHVPQDHTLVVECHFANFIHVLQRFMDGMTKYSGVLVDELSRVEAELDSCLADLLEKLKASAQAMSDSTFWTFLQKIATFLSTAFTFLMGGAAIAASHAVIGGILLTAGVLSLTHFLLNEYQGWDSLAYQIVGNDEKKRQQFMAYVPPAVGITAAALGLAGNVHAVFLKIPMPNYMMIAQAAFMLFQGTTSIGSGVSKYREIDANALVKEVQANQTWLEHTQGITTTVIENQGTEHRTALFDRFIKKWTESCEAVHQIS